MPDFEKLMQSSETMRMLKIGNPERSKDFGIPELQSGLFELERQTRENLENLIYTSPDPNGSIIKHDTALMLNNLGLDMETSRKLAEGGFASAATGIDTRSKSYGDALITKAQHAYWDEMRGVNTSLYRFTGNPEFLKNAQEYDKKVFQNPVFESYGGLGDLVLDSVQPAISSAKFLLTNAILSWIPGGVANKVWGPAIAKLISSGGGIAATGINFLSTGYSQAGNVLYDVMQMTDGEGNTLPWDSPVGGILFHGLAGLMGLVELGSMEMFPWYKQLKSRFTSREVADYLKKGIAKSLLDVTFKGVVGTAAESIEEGLQSGLEDGFTNALKALANKDGADFDLISLGDSVKKGAKAFWDAGRSMFLTSFLSAGIGQGVYASKVRIEAAKNFKKSDSSQSVDSSFLGVPRSAVAEAKAEEAKKGEQAKSASADTEETKIDPIKVVNVGPRLSPVNDEELHKAAKAVNLGAKAMEVEVVEMPEMQAEDKVSLINRAALASGARIIDGEELGFEDEQSMIKGMYLIAPSVEAIDDSSVGKIVTIRNENGELSKISMRVIPEDMREVHIADPDIMYAEDPKAPYALSMMSEERALEWEERNLIRNALGDVTTHTKGRFSSADVEASIDAVKTIAETLNMPTDKLLSEGVVFHLTDKVQDEWGNEALGSITSNITVDGKKQYTVNLSKKANVSTVLHELGHLLRGFATKEQLAEFRKYYGEGEEAAFLEDINLVDGKYQVGSQVFDTLEDASKYVTGNEERFADDFVAYMLTGEAPTQGLKNIFKRMKAVLHKFIAQYGNRLTPEVKVAFDNLLSGEKPESALSEDTTEWMKEGTLYQTAPPDYQPKKIGKGYKVFAIKDGKLYPPKVANPNGEDTPIGVWLLADAAPIEGYSKTGRPQVKSGGKGTNGGSGPLAYRPGWHLGEIPYAKQFNKKNPVNGEKELFPANFVWAEVEYAMDHNYNEEAQAHGVTKNGRFNHALAGLSKMPEHGYYNYRTNPDPTTDPWVITGAMKVNRVLSKEEVDALVIAAGRSPQLVEGNMLYQKDQSPIEYAQVYNKYFNTDQWLKAPNGEWSNLNEQQWVTVRTPTFKSWFGDWDNNPEKASRIVDDNGEPRVVFHGSPNKFDTFDKKYLGDTTDFGWFGTGFYFALQEEEAVGYGDNVYSLFLNIRNPFNYNEMFYKIHFDSDSVPSLVRFWYNSATFMERYVKDDSGFPKNETSEWEANGNFTVIQLKEWVDQKSKTSITPFADVIEEQGIDVDFIGEEIFSDFLLMIEQFNKFLKESDYDGVINAGGSGEQIIAFEPDQIKSASDLLSTTLYQIDAYHGTSKNFEKFSTDFVGSGFRGGAYGWGLYFTTDEAVARNYAEIIGNRNLEKRVLYRINLGRIRKHTLLSWSEPINERVRNMLREPMLKLEYPQSLHRRYGTSTTEGLVSMALGENATGNSLYFFLEKAFDDWSGEKASLFLREHGITGTVKSDLMGNYTYAIFDENAVEIVGKTLYKMAPPLGTEDFKKWYGSSVLVDGKGNPIEVLHGSQSMFNDFARTQENDNGYLGAGHYFTGIRGIALTYATKNNDGYIYHAYLKMENPLRYDQEWDKKWTEIRNEVVAENPEVPENSNLFGKLLEEKIQDNGYDGVLDMRNGNVAEAVVFSNDQIGIVAVESYNLGEAGSEYNKRKIGEMRQRQIAKNAVLQAIPDLDLAQGNLVPPTLYQVQNLPKWKEDTRAWMKANGYTGAQIDRHIAGIEGQLKIFDFVGPYEIGLLPHGAGLNPWKRVSQKGDATYQGGPIRTNDDPIYRISFDLSAMCPKRLSAAATANYVQKKIGRPLSDSERMALTALYRAHGKEAPCIYCYVESPRSKASSFVLKALEVVLGGEAPKTWSSETLSLAEEARAEAVAKNVQRGDLNAHMLMDPELASSDEFKAEVDKYPVIYKFLKKQMLNAKANLPKLYEEYEGQILNLPDDFIDMLNGYAGIRFFSSSDFQAQHVVDLIQAVYDMNVRGARAHAYTKVPKFVEVFGGTGIKINTSIFAKEENGQIVEDNWQGMGWEDAKRFRQQYNDVGTILVASSDKIVKWALEQDWIDYIIPFHYSSLEKKYYSTMNWEDFTSTQVEKPINVSEEVQKIRQFETGSVDGISNAEGTRRYLELAMQRGIIPVFPTFLFNDGMEDVVGKNGKPYKNQRKAKTDRAVTRWQEMVESGRLDWSQINHNYYKLRKDYARTDTPFHVVKPNINFEQASDILKEYLSGAEDGVRGEREIGDELVRMIIDSDGTDIDLGVEVLRGVQEGRMSGKDPLFQRMSPPGSQEFMSWYKGSMLVDGDGAPLKLYHGTASIFTEYNSEYRTLNMGDSEGFEGFFFTTDKDEANSYAEFAVSPEVMAYRDEHRAVLRKMGELGVKRGSDHPLEDRAIELEQMITEAEDLIEIGGQAWDPVVSGVYVRITNPAIIDLSDPDIPGEIDFQQLIQEAKASGHDGFIYKNVNESDEIHVVAFSDSQVGAVDYSLSSEGYEMDHEFPTTGDATSESAIDYRGHKIIPHDLGMDYSEKNLDGIIEKVDQELKQITLYQSKLEWEPYPLEISTGLRLSQKEKGFKDRAYTNMWGWDGSEDHPTIDGDWTKFRKLDLEGAILRDVSDIAKLFSIYRNPYIEFFHIIYTREMADGTTKIKGHHAMTSGAPGFSIARSRRFPNDIAEGMKKYRATGYYLMHNHPSGNVTPSDQDREITSRYLMNTTGFRGHIILNHDKFFFYNKHLSQNVYNVPEGFHKVPGRSPIYNMSFSSPDELGIYGIRTMGSREMLVMYLDNQHRVVHAQPAETFNIDEIYENVEKYLYSKVVLVTSSKKRYQEALDADRYARVFKGEAFLDIVLHHTLKKDGSITITSALATGQLGQSGHDFWHTQYLKKKGTLPGADNYVFEKGKTLYQLSDEARKTVVESRKQDVKAAVEQFYWIPDDVLREYAGETWADREIRFRNRLKENPWVLDEARGYTDPDEYLEFVTSRDMQNGKESSAEAKRWWRRVYEYARVESAAERNLRFVREHASTDKDLIALGKRLRAYIVTDSKTGKRWYRWGSFRGVSPLVKSLSVNSPREDIQKARALVTNNPEPYRKALQKITQSERVVDNEGKFDLPNKEDREAYYDSLGEEMSDTLNEVVLMNQMADSEEAEFLRKSVDQRGKYTSREKMATHNGVLEIEKQADKELVALRAEYEKNIENLEELQKRFEIVTKEVNKLGDALKETRKDRSRLKGQLKDTRETAVNLRAALSDKREGYRKLEKERAALEKKLHAVRTRRDLERYHKAILASAKFNPNSVDASYEEALNTIHELFRQDHKEGGYKMLPEVLTRYLDDEGLHAIKANKRIGDWSLHELGTLYYAIRAMKTDARVMLEQKKVDRSGKLQNLAIKYYSQLYGELPEIDPLEGGVMGSIMEELSLKQKKYQETMFGALWNTVAGAVIHSQRLARIIDGNLEGVMYHLLVRRAYENSNKELSHSFERLEAAEAKMLELKVTDKSLRQDLYTYTTIAGDKITLNRGEVIGLYVYGQNKQGMEKLIMSWGNGIPFNQLAEAVAKLTDAEKAWGDYMIDNLGGDDPWERMRDVYYNVYNQNLGKRQRYFTFIADGNLNEGNTDMLNGPKGRPIRYTDKGMTEKVVPHARYALKLDVTHTFTQQVKRQEHFIAWAEWVRDLNYLLSSRGSIGAMIEANHGSKILTQVQDFVNDIGSPQIILDDIERLGNKIISNAAVGALSFNALTPLKQLASLSAVVRGDINISSLFHAARRLANPAIQKKVVEMIHEKSPKMKDRTFDVEVAKYNATEFDTEIGMIIQAINEKVGMKAIGWMDQLVANLIWLSAYDTALKRGATDAEAAFRATEVVGETQSSTNVSDLSSLQRKKNPWLRAVLMFTNDVVQHINQIWFDVPYFVRNKQYRKAFGTLTSLAVAGAISMLVSGKLFRNDDDDEEYLKRIGKEILQVIVSDTIPIVGNSVASGVSGWGGGDMVDLPSAFGRFMGSAADGDGDRMMKSFINLVEAGLKLGALPVTSGNRVVRAVREQNPLHLLNYDYAELWEEWL